MPSEQRSPEEAAASLQWLRDHGVEVESPADRAAAKLAAAELRSLRKGDAGSRCFRYVRVPADDSEPLEPLEGVVYSDARGRGDQLPKLLAPAFAGGSVNADALRQATPEAMAGSLPGGAGGGQLTPEAIEAQGGSTETFRLSDTVFMYLDEVGSLKRQPPNKRASQLAAWCGYGDAVVFCGDTFIGRVAAEDGGRNVDLTPAEITPGAGWVQTAAAENMAQQQAEGGRPGGISGEELATRGGEGQGYSWTQDPSDVEITVPVPAGTRGKDVKAKFASSSFTISVPGGAELALELFARVAADGCSWSLSDGAVVASLEKATEGETWPTLTKGS